MTLSQQRIDQINCDRILSSRYREANQNSTTNSVVSLPSSSETGFTNLLSSEESDEGSTLSVEYLLNSLSFDRDCENNRLFGFLDNVETSYCLVKNTGDFSTIKIRRAISEFATDESLLSVSLFHPESFIQVQGRVHRSQDRLFDPANYLIKSSKHPHIFEDEATGLELAGDTTQDRIRKAVSKLTVNYSRNLSERLEALASLDIDDDEQEISINSVVDFVKFLNKEKPRKPSIVITQDGYIQTQWKSDPENLVTIVFKENNFVSYVIFKKNPSGDSIFRLSGDDNVDTALSILYSKGAKEMMFEQELFES